MTTIFKRVLVIAVPLLLTACASTPRFRELATTTGQMVQSLEEGTATFVRDQNALNAENAARLDRLRRETDRAERAARRQRLAFSGGSQNRADLFDVATERDAATIIAAARPHSAAPATLSASGAAEYEAARKALATLSVEPSTLSSLGSLLEFGDAVRTELETLREEAEAAAEEAADEPEKLDPAPSSAADGGGGT